MASKTNEKSSAFERQLRKTPVAIIGMASIFPQARNLPEYWDNILNKVNAVTDVPASRWNIDDYYDPDPSTPDKVYCKRGGFLPDIDFDPTEFGLPPNILEVTDVSQLLGLVVARDALNDAGYGEGREFNRENTGVILGVVGVSTKLYAPLVDRLQYPVWERVLKASGVSDGDTRKIIEKIKLAYVGWEENSFPGSLGNVVAGRIANRFDLGGTNCVLDAACATSMAAIKMAVMELVESRADMMITGGVDTDNSIGVYMSFSKTPAFSKGQSVKTFDADSDGMMAGEGIGMLVLKRLADAERDGDRIYAVIRGVGSSSDGRYKSIYAPRPSGQAKALRRAYEEAGYEPTSVGLIEAHGTGTPAGDPAEFMGLREAFGGDPSIRQVIALGSVKSQIAHTKGAAGSAGLIKVALALYNKVLPPTINVNRPNPKLDIENSPFYINSETRPWFRRDAKTPRRAGVSAFGFGGTNFHIAVEEYEREQSGAYRTSSVAQTILLAAATPDDLLVVCNDTYTKLQAVSSEQYYNQLVDGSQTLELPLSHARLGFTAGSLKEAQELLQVALDTLKQRLQDESWEHPKGIYYRKAGIDPKGKVVALFSGQGSQYLDMGRELACNFPPVRQAFSEMDELFVKDGLAPLSSRVYPPPTFDQQHCDLLSAQLTRTEHAQPAIGTISVGLYRMLQQAGFKADFTAGHSFGELTALWASGVLSDKDYYFLAKARGKAMAAPDDPAFDTGTMLAVKGDAQKVKEEIKEFPEITLANWNSDNQIVLAGSKAAIAKIQQHLGDKGYSVVQLPVSAAFHTPLVGHAQKPFADAIDTVKFNRPVGRLYSNTSGKAHASDPEKIRAVLKGHILNPVLFRDEIENIYGEGGSIFVEFGPKNVLTNLVKSILANRPHVAVALNANAKKDSDRQFRDAVLQLRIAGIVLQPVDPYQAPRKVAPARKNSPVTVKLNGGHYISPKTRAAFEEALQDGWKISQAVPVVPAASAPPPMPVAPPVIPVAVQPPQAAAPATLQPVNFPAAIYALESSLTLFREHQSEVVKLHEKYLRNEEMSGQIYARLSELEIELISNASAEKMQQIVPVFESLERSMARFHEHQAETLRVHAQYLKSQEEFSQNFVRLAQQQLESGPVVRQAVLAAPVVVSTPAAARSQAVPAAVIPTPARAAVQIVVPQTPARPAVIPEPVAAKPASNGVKPAAHPVQTAKPTAAYDVQALTKALLEVVSEKTGYPVEMLELETDMEADLGIDSIKRVEILGEMRNRFPNLPKADPEAFAEVRTLGQTVKYMDSSAANTANPNGHGDPSVLPEVVSEVPVAAPASPSGAYDIEILTKALLEVVSEKTGYPVEMLELETDMEADLGIDSIKRVEILGEMRNRFPNLPKADPEAFAEVRTLGQTVKYMYAAGPSAPAPAAAVKVAEPSAAEPVQTTEPAIVAASVALMQATVGAYAVEDLTAALLKIVSEKTGYPVEMLELGTDMEADLGIDSIKRVEILGEMRNQFPNLPKADPEAFSEVRTLGKIIDYLGRDVSSGEQVRQFGAEAANELIDPSIPRGVVNLKSLPQPDFSEFSLPENHICLLSDNGTPTTAVLAQKLAGRNWKVVVLSYPAAIVPAKGPLPEGIQRVTLSDMSEEHLQAQLAEISTKFGPVGAFVHLNPSAAAGPDSGMFSEVNKEIIKYVFLLAKHLKEPLTAAAKQGRSVFMVVVNLDGEFGLGDKIDFDPISGGLFGLVKTLNLEWEAVFCRAVDISPELDTTEAARRIVAELHDPNRLVTEVGYSSKGRSTLVVEQTAEGVAA